MRSILFTAACCVASPRPCQGGLFAGSCLTGVSTAAALSGAWLSESQPHSVLTFGPCLESWEHSPPVLFAHSTQRTPGGVVKTALSSGAGPGHVISCSPVSTSFSCLAPGTQAPLLWPLPEAAAASCALPSCHGPQAVPGAQRGQPLGPDAASSSLIWNSGLHRGPPAHLSLKHQGQTKRCVKAWATSLQC